MTAQDIVPFKAGGRVLAIIPQTMKEAWEIAEIVMKAGIAPDGVDSVEMAMVAIMTGAEVGMAPMTAMQSIAVINKRPTIWGDGALGLVRASGLLEEIKETEEMIDDSLTAICKVQRRGEAPVIRTFSMADADRAGLINNPKKPIWKLYPNRMLQMRARAYALRDTFPDVFKGLGIREEVQDYHMKDVTPTQTTQGSPPVEKKQVSGPPAHLFEENEPATSAAPKAAEVPQPEAKPEAEILPPAVARANRLKKLPQVIEDYKTPAVFLRHVDEMLKVIKPHEDAGKVYLECVTILSNIAAETSADESTTTTMMEIMRTHERRLGLGG
jgi:hypothetical protein